MLRNSEVTAAKPLETIQACRGLAACLVLLFHTSQTYFEAPKFWNTVVFDRVFDFGDAGVDFFFVLSGLIISAAHRRDIGRPDRVGRYLWKRAARICPPYWVALILITALYLLAPNGDRTAITDRTTLTGSVLLVGRTHAATLFVAWSLFHELLFYLLFAAAILDRRLGAAVLIGWFALCVVCSLARIEPPYHLAFMNILFGFGMAAHWWGQRRRVVFPLGLATLGAVAFVAIGMAQLYAGMTAPALLVLGYGCPSALILVGLVEWERSGPTRTVPRALTQLGDASYSIYLIQCPALSLIARVWIRVFGVRGVPVHFAFIGVALLTLAAGFAFYHLVERPLARATRAWPRQVWGSRPAVA